MKKLILFLYDNFRIYGLPILSAAGFFLAFHTVQAGSQSRPVALPVSEPAQSDFKSYVAGAGMVESSGENVAIASEVSGVVSSVFVAVDQKVKKDEPLFMIDDRALRAQLEVRQSSLDVAKAQIADAQAQYDFMNRINDKRAVSADELTKRKNVLLVAQAKKEEAESGVHQIETEIGRLTVKAPRDGTILKINIRPGEYAPAQLTTTPLILMGNTDKLWVRIDIDENDAWRVQKGARAHAKLRGNSALGMDLSFVRFEPYVIPKRSLTGENAERVDTRVLQIVYEFEPSKIPVYVGQLMDVFIEAQQNG